MNVLLTDWPTFADRFSQSAESAPLPRASAKAESNLRFAWALSIAAASRAATERSSGGLWNVGKKTACDPARLGVRPLR